MEGSSGLNSLFRQIEHRRVPQGLDGEIEIRKAELSKVIRNHGPTLVGNRFVDDSSPDRLDLRE